ncbi:MAG TPA: hypothetical protein VFS34_01360, partial [Thermoanaerobaculia bacterium]|nr:hypothetical protein [Thermoanaerobaculia bacterium]
HALHWLEYGYLQEGRRSEAGQALADMERATSRDPSERAWDHLAWMRAADIVDAPRDSRAADIRIPEAKLSRSARADDAFATGFAALRRGGDAGKSLASLEELAKEGAEGRHTAMSETMAEIAGILRDELWGAALAQEGRTDEAVRLVGEAADREEKMPYGFGPPEPAKPARELLGELLLAAGRKADARQAFETELRRAPKRRLSLAGLKAASE